MPTTFRNECQAVWALSLAHQAHPALQLQAAAPPRYRANLPAPISHLDPFVLATLASLDDYLAERLVFSDFKAVKDTVTVRAAWLARARGLLPAAALPSAP